MDNFKIILAEKDIPREWYNVAADVPFKLPPIHPGTGKPLQANDLAAIFPMALIAGVL